MITLHHLNNSRSQRVVWMLELLKLDYEIKVYQRDATTNLAPNSLKQVHSLGTAPIITDGDQTIIESGAICEYLSLKAGDTELMPAKDSPEFMDVQFWSHYAEGSFVPHLVTAMVLNKGKEKASPFPIKFIVGKFVDAIMNAYFGMAIKRNTVFVEQHLAGREWLVGDKPTVADVQMSFALEAMQKAGRLAGCPNMQAYVTRLQADHAYMTAMHKMQSAEKAAGIE